MTRREKRNYTYNQILNEKQGKDYIFQIEIIKDEQCRYCEKCGKVNCRLNAQDLKCENFQIKTKQIQNKR